MGNVESYHIANIDEVRQRHSRSRPNECPSSSILLIRKLGDPTTIAASAHACIEEKPVVQRQTRNVWRGRVAGGAAVVSLGILGVPMTAAAAATSTDSPARCSIDGSNAVVHFALTKSPTPPRTLITGLRISGLSVTACTGDLPATVAIEGTPSGDPTAAPTETLTSLDSTLDPCTGRLLADPAYVTGGAITLPACPTGGPGGYADVHDATRLILRVAGQPIVIGKGGNGQSGVAPGTTVLGEKLTQPTASHHTGTSAATAAPSGVLGLAFTGSWIGRLLSAAGLALVLGALLIAATSERRRRRLS